MYGDVLAADADVFCLPYAVETRLGSLSNSVLMTVQQLVSRSIASFNFMSPVGTRYARIHPRSKVLPRNSWNPRHT